MSVYQFMDTLQNAAVRFSLWILCKILLFMLSMCHNISEPFPPVEEQMLRLLNFLYPVGFDVSQDYWSMMQVILKLALPKNLDMQTLGALNCHYLFERRPRTRRYGFIPSSSGFTKL
jgi:hypothetical protein